jgi:serine/threonine protein kinase/tetratricopeptide (TPR) repeat protein
MDDRWLRLRTLVGAALELPTSERGRFLDDACGGDETLRAEAQSLVTGDAGTDGFLEAPALAGNANAGEGDGLPGSSAATPGAVIGAYRLDTVLGQGGMGVVFSASRTDGVYEGQVAIKLMHASAVMPLAPRLIAERQILASLSHPGIARLLDGGATADGRPYLVMERVEGVPIDRFCEEHQLGVRERLELFLKVCEPVQYAHRNLVIHRDLKPSNILVTAEGEPKLLDFGIAKLLDPGADQSGEVTRTGFRPLTPGYASPEQLRGEPMSTASDVYALGVLLYKLLTGTLPRRLTEYSPAAIERALREQPIRPSVAVMRGEKIDVVAAEDATTAAGHEPARSRQLARKLAGDVDTVVLTALRDEPTARYGSVVELTEDLKRYLDGLPVMARPQTLGYRTGKFVRRHRVVVGATASLITVLLAFALTVTVQARSVALERDKAQQVSAFLVELFEKADPEKTNGETITAREVVDRGAARVEAGLDGQPEVRAMLLLTLGKVYASLGLHEPSVRLLNMAIEAREQSSGRDDPGLVPILLALAGTQLESDAYDETRESLERALAIGEEKLGDRNNDVIECLTMLASVHLMEGDYQRSEALSRRAIAAGTRLHGENDPSLATSLITLGRVRRVLGDLQESTSLLERATTLLEGAGPEAGADLAICLSDLGLTYSAKGDLAPAISVLERSVALSERLYGPDHPVVATALNNLAMVVQDSGDLECTEQLYRRALAIKAQIFGESSPGYAASLSNLADLELDRGELKAAREDWQHVLEICESVLGPQHEHSATTRMNLAMVDIAEGSLVAAESHLADAVTALEAALGPEHPRVGSAVGLRAELLLELDRPAEAEPLARRSLAILESCLGEQHLGCQIQLTRLARVLVSLGRLEEAEPLLLRAVELERAGATTPAATAELASSLLHLGELYRQKADSTRASAAWEEGLRLLESTPQGSVSTLHLEVHASLLADLGRAAEARPLVEELWAKGVHRPAVAALAQQAGLV